MPVESSVATETADIPRNQVRAGRIVARRILGAIARIDRGHYSLEELACAEVNLIFGQPGAPQFPAEYNIYESSEDPDIAGRAAPPPPQPAGSRALDGAISTQLPPGRGQATCDLETWQEFQALRQVDFSPAEAVDLMVEQRPGDVSYYQEYLDNLHTWAQAD